jgi:outer membrane protein TolC
VRRAERLLAAQSAEIGIAKSDLLPHVSLVGTINLDAEKAHNLFEGRSFEGFGGPTFRWAILNYGRITNNVRVQDARYQALVGDYEATVLRAQADVEGAAAFYLGSIRRTASLTESVAAAQKAVDVVALQYREGAIDFTSVLVAQDFLVTQQSALAVSRGETALGLIALYKALGGGWEPWQGQPILGDETIEQMRARTRWGALLDERDRADDLEAARTGTENDRGWWRWRWWRPRW